MNLTEVICTSKDGDRFWKLPTCYIRGSAIKYLRLPPQLLEKAREEGLDQERQVVIMQEVVEEEVVVEAVEVGGEVGVEDEVAEGVDEAEEAVEEVVADEVEAITNPTRIKKRTKVFRHVIPSDDQPDSDDQ
ncbi:MAG: hypothetical protein SGBAC_002240 [Bacillariaceae sp.]